MNEPPIEVEYRGVVYRRNPQGEQRAHRVYYSARDHDLLHRAVYRGSHGDIPTGYHVHHIDFDPFNNDPGNLIALSPSEHARVHPGFDRQTPEWLEHLAEIRPMSAEWHGSEEGLAWHREHGRKTWDSREPTTLGVTCTDCGGEISTFFPEREGEGGIRFCSRRCINRYNERTKRYHKDVECPVCGTPFKQRRGSPKSCSRTCGAVLRVI